MSKKQQKVLFRIIFSFVMLVAVKLLSLEGGPLSGEKSWIFCVYMVPYLVIGSDVLLAAGRNILHGQVFDEQFLMAIATLGAFGVGDFAEAVAVMLFYQVGELFQSIAVGKSRRSIAALMDICPETAVVLRDGKEETVYPQEVHIGETICVRPGEKIPLDGVILDGSTSINAAALTGESLPQDKQAGDTVISGSVNLNGKILVRVESKYEDSTVSKILELVENASSRKAKAENFITRFARYYTPCVVIGAVLLAVLPPLLFSGSWSEWIHRALVFLVVSCPCALVVSVPLSFFGGIGGASRKGILIKGANYLEQLSKVKTVVFDKTGTLTKGNFTVTAIHPELMSEKELLGITAAAESYSNHPIAESILLAQRSHTSTRGCSCDMCAGKHAGRILDHRKPIDISIVGEITEIAGKGIRAVIDGHEIYVGNGLLMEDAGADWHECNKQGTVIHISEGSDYLGHIIISDEIKADSRQSIIDLKNLGIQKTIMLTGDAKQVGEAVGRELSIDEIHTELLPADKVELVEREMQKNQTLAFVGDGINDAPVLTRADIGVAMGALGSDAAIEAADVVLLNDNPSALPKAVRIARKTMRIVKQNIAFALGVKAVVLALGAMGLTGLWAAVFADVGVMVIAIINAMRSMSVK